MADQNQKDDPAGSRKETMVTEPERRYEQSGTPFSEEQVSFLKSLMTESLFTAMKGAS